MSLLAVTCDVTLWAVMVSAAAVILGITVWAGPVFMCVLFRAAG